MCLWKIIPESHQKVIFSFNTLLHFFKTGLYCFSFISNIFRWGGTKLLAHLCLHTPTHNLQTFYGTLKYAASVILDIARHIVLHMRNIGLICTFGIQLSFTFFFWSI